ncbi:MAG: hypothetical protein JOZ72_12255 [Alphaproteobacteria bacterium]|nr:hypothetical protein [Alphaproteobacteria bacterium]
MVRKALDRVQAALDRYHWWEFQFLAIGFVSTIAIVVVLLLPLGNGPLEIRASDAVPPAGSPAFMSQLANTLSLPVEQAPPIDTFNNGDAFLKALLADIDGARLSIDFMVYIWKDGTFSDQVLAHLEQKQRAGVQVRIVLDAYGGLTAPSEKLSRLEALGGKVAVFHSLMPLPWTMARDHKRNHRRSIVIDGAIGYTGGIAVDDVWLGDARNPSQWRDMMFRVRGSMASHLQGAFSELWVNTTGELLVGPKFYPDTATPAETGMRYVPLASAPSPDRFEMENFLLLSLLGARQRIVMVTPYFLPDDTMEQALIGKAKAGVAVTILVPNDLNDSHSVRAASQYLYDDLLKAGVKIYEFQPTFIHTKLLVVDGTWSVIGSANMDNRSRKLNDEVVFGISGQAFAAGLERTIATDLKRSKRIDKSEWERRGWWQRAGEILARLLVQQY